MQLNDLQLEIMQLGADKELKFGCLIYGYGRNHKIVSVSELDYNVIIQDGDTMLSKIHKYDRIYEIIGHPITYSRLCYLKRTDKKPEVIIDGIKSKMEKWINVCFAFESNPELYNQSILEWSDEVLDLVRDFLLSIQ